MSRIYQKNFIVLYYLGFLCIRIKRKVKLFNIMTIYEVYLHEIYLDLQTNK